MQMLKIWYCPMQYMKVELEKQIRFMFKAQHAQLMTKGFQNLQQANLYFILGSGTNMKSLKDPFLDREGLAMS